MVIAVTVAHLVAAIVGTLAVIRAVVVLVVRVNTVIRIVAALFCCYCSCSDSTNLSFPCRPGGVCDRWGTTTGHLRRLTRLRAHHTMSLHCWRLHLGCKPRMQCNAAVTPSNPECSVIQQSHHQTPNAV